MYIKRLQALSGVRYKRLYLGQWCAADGVVFEHFDPQKHFIDRCNLPPLRRTVAGVDWGFTNAGVISVWSSDGDGRAYRVAEVYRTAQLLDWWIEQAQRLRNEFKIEVFRCDPSRPDYIAAFQNAGLNALEAENDITFGIDAIASRLNVADDGKPRLFFVRDAVIGRDETLAEANQPWCTEHEMELYAWQTAREGLNAKEKPIDAHNHGIDAMRYAINELDLTIVAGSASIEETL
jgi:phage terminase large subunit